MKLKLITLIAASTFMQCHKPCNESDHQFSINSNFLPEKDSMNVGDTLILTCVTSKIMYDEATNTDINFRNAQNFGSALVISDVSKFLSAKRGAVDSFNFILVMGEIYTDSNLDPNGTKQLKFSETNNNYELKANIIPMRKGVYIFSIGDNPSVFIQGKGKCGKASIEILNNNTNKHLYLFENSLGQLSVFHKKHSYCLKVY